MAYKYLSFEQVIKLNSLVTGESGGLSGLRDYKRLDASIQAPHASMKGRDIYDSALEKGAILGYLLISNHPFIDGNKRVGLLAMLMFFKFNGVELKYSDQEMITLIMKVASGQMDFRDMFKVIKDMSVKEIDDEQLISAATENIKVDLAIYEELGK